MEVGFGLVLWQSDPGFGCAPRSMDLSAYRNIQTVAYQVEERLPSVLYRYRLLCGLAVDGGLSTVQSWQRVLLR